MKMKAITKQLVKLSKEQDLSGKTMKHLVEALRNFKEEEPSEFVSLFGKKDPEDVKVKFYKQSLVFRHAFLDHFYMDTEYRLRGQDKMEAGSYRLITDHVGDVVDDYLVLES